MEVRVIVNLFLDKSPLHLFLLMKLQEFEEFFLSLPIKVKGACWRIILTFHEFFNIVYDRDKFGACKFKP